MSLTNKRIKDYIKDERAGSQTYKRASKKVKAKTAKNTFKMMARDETRHERYLKKMLK